MAVEVAVDYVGRPSTLYRRLLCVAKEDGNAILPFRETVEYPGTATPASALLIEEYKFLLNYISLFW